MKYLGLTIALLFCVLVFGQPAYAQCSSGKINGEYHTSCYAWGGGDGYISGTSQRNDTPRLLRMIADAYYGGKLVFDEENYFINDELALYSYQLVEGTGRGIGAPTPLPSPMPSPTPTPSVYHHTSKIIQTANNKSIFKLAESIRAVSIRDLTMMSGNGATGTIGILMRGGDVDNFSALYIQLSNLNFNNLHKGIYVNAVDDPEHGDTTGLWQCDNVRLDHAAFEYCDIGIHINSYNSGWNMTSLEFFVPEGDSLDKGDPLDSDKTYGIFFERSAYTTVDMAIGNGTAGQDTATALMYVQGHGNLSIRNMIDEGFKNSVYIEGGDLSVPIHLMNNYYQSPLTVHNSTVVSTANQFHIVTAEEPAVATGGSHIYSYGDKFCLETGSPCDFTGYTLFDTAQIINSEDQTKALSTVPNFITRDYYDKPALSIVPPTYAGPSLLQMGQGSYVYDITRDGYTGYLSFKGNHNNYSGYSFGTKHDGSDLAVVINNDGSVTYGSTTYTDLAGSFHTLTNGTVIYCSNCTKATPCGSGGSGALAKRINGAWDCD